MTQSQQPSITLVPRKRRLSLVIWMEGGSTPSLLRRLQLRKGLIQSGRNSLLVRLDGGIFFKQDPGFRFVWSFGRICLYKVYFYNSGAIYLIFVTPFTYGTEASRSRYQKTWKNNLLNSYWNIAITARQKR